MFRHEHSIPAFGRQPVDPVQRRFRKIEKRPLFRFLLFDQTPKAQRPGGRLVRGRFVWLGECFPSYRAMTGSQSQARKLDPGGRRRCRVEPGGHAPRESRMIRVVRLMEAGPRKEVQVRDCRRMRWVNTKTLKPGEWSRQVSARSGRGVEGNLL